MAKAGEWEHGDTGINVTTKRVVDAGGGSADFVDFSLYFT
jgi:hypothetical protein